MCLDLCCTRLTTCLLTSRLAGGQPANTNSQLGCLHLDIWPFNNFDYACANIYCPFTRHYFEHWFSYSGKNCVWVCLLAITFLLHACFSPECSAFYYLYIVVISDVYSQGVKHNNWSSTVIWCLQKFPWLRLMMCFSPQSVQCVPFMDIKPQTWEEYPHRDMSTPSMALCIFGWMDGRRWNEFLSIFSQHIFR